MKLHRKDTVNILMKSISIETNRSYFEREYTKTEVFTCFINLNYTVLLWSQIKGQIIIFF